jgi:uncharacterized protein (TIGR02284 family)
MIDRSEHAVLNHLVETCRDGERGFRLAAELVKDPGLKTLFSEFAQQRATFAEQLLPHAQRLGGNAPAQQTRLASLHRGWMALEAALMHDDQVIAAEVEQGNRATMDLYGDAIRGMLPPEVRDLVAQQFRELEATHARIPVREGLGQ